MRHARTAVLAVVVLLVVSTSIVGAVVYETSDRDHIRTSPQPDQLIRDIQIVNDGNTLLVIDTDDQLKKYSLADPYNITSATEQQTLALPGTPRGFEFKDDGLTFVYADRNNAQIREYSLSIAYDLSTASQTATLDTSANEGAPYGVTVNSDGTELIISGHETTDSDLNQYTMSSAWDLSTATHTREETDVVTSRLDGIDIAKDGTRLYGASSGEDNAIQWNLSDPSNVSTITENTSFNDFSWTGVLAAEITEDGQYFYVFDSPDASVYQYRLTDATISGTVTDSDGNPIEEATVSTNTSITTTTNASGGYSMAVDDGVYEVTASKEDFSNNTQTVTVSGSDVTLDFTLLEERFILDIEPFMKHGTNQSYQVFNGPTEVTGTATVTSSNDSVVLVDSTNEMLRATSDTDINQEVTITAEYQNNTVEKNVTVALQTAENADLMPTGLTMGVALVGNAPNPITGDRPGGTQLTMQLILVAVLAAVAATRAAGSYAGIGAIVLTMAGGWFMGWVGHGMMLVTIYIALFIGLNVAANSGATLPSRPGR